MGNLLVYFCVLWNLESARCKVIRELRSEPMQEWVYIRISTARGCEIAAPDVQWKGNATHGAGQLLCRQLDRQTGPHYNRGRSHRGDWPR